MLNQVIKEYRTFKIDYKEIIGGGFEDDSRVRGKGRHQRRTKERGFEMSSFARMSRKQNEKKTIEIPIPTPIGAIAGPASENSEGIYSITKIVYMKI